MSQPRYDLDAYDYDLPPESIAQEPVEPRDRSRLLVLDRDRDTPRHAVFRDLPDFLDPGDLLVLNDTRVLPARVYGRRSTGGKVEVLFLREAGEAEWDALLRSGGALRPGERLQLGAGEIEIRLVKRQGRGAWRVSVPRGRLTETLERIGVMPLPPYIRRETDDPRGNADRHRYQTVYARNAGAVAAPTAGLHFTEEVLGVCERKGIGRTFLTLHVGAGTFRPIQSADIRDHVMHGEAYTLSAEASRAIRETRRQGHRVVAVGTTSCRVIETAARCGLAPATGETDLYIAPPYDFRATDAILTNFHLPRSTLLVMICAFAGRERVLSAYETCKRAGYRFYSYGDAMLIL